MKSSRSVLVGAAVVLVGAVLPLVSSIGVASATTTISVAAGTGDGAESCTPTPTPTSCTTLRAAVDYANANPGTAISLGSGTFALSNGSLKVSAPMSITGRGQSGASATIINQTGVDRVVEISTFGLVSLTGLEVTGGVAKADPTVNAFDSHRAVGGGIYSDQASLTLTNVRVDHNTAIGDTGVTTWASGQGEGASGAGVYVHSHDASANPLPALTITGSTIDHNTARGGNAVTLSGWSERGGRAVGGGIDFEIVTMTMTDTSVASNTAQGGDGTATGVVCDDSNKYCDGGWAFGGGVYTLNGATINSTITRSTIADNAALGGSVPTKPPAGAPASGGPFGGDADGGGLFGVSSVVNSTVVGNQAVAGDAPSPLTPVGVVSGSARGGGISQVTLSLRSDTINGNHVDGTNDDGDWYGGGNVALPPPGSAGHVTIGETILSHGTMGEFSVPSNCLSWAPAPSPWTFTDRGSNLVSTTAADCGLGAGTGDHFGVDPKLVALASNGGPTQTEALGVGSPALGAVDSNGFCQFVDQRGLPRPAIGCDIGAYEHQQAPPPPPPPAPPGVPAQSLVLNRNGTLRVKVSCPGPTACTDLIQVTTTRVGSNYTYRVYQASDMSVTTYRIVLASKRVTISAGHTVAVTLVATLRARRLIRSHPRGLRVTIRVSNLGNHRSTNRRSIIRPHR